MKKNDLSVFQMEKEGFKILLKKGPSGYNVSSAPAPAPVFHATPMPQQADPAPPSFPVAERRFSPIGTFYAGHVAGLAGLRQSRTARNRPKR